MSEVLPWLNLLLIPVCGLLLNVSHTMGALAATQREHERRLNWLDAIKANAK